MSSEQDFPHVPRGTETQIDLSIIREHLDAVEQALIIAYQAAEHGRPLSFEQTAFLSSALDRLLTIEEDFGRPSFLKPVVKRQSAITRQQRVLFPVVRSHSAGSDGWLDLTVELNGVRYRGSLPRVSPPDQDDA